MMLKKIVMAGIMATILAGCSANQTSVVTATADPQETTPAEATTQEDNDESIFSQQPTGQKIVVLTNNGGQGRDVWLQEKASAAGFNIEIVSIGAADATARVISEINNPTVNVIWGPSETQFTSMIEAGALAPFVPEWKENVAGLSEENGYSWSYEIQPKVLVANPDIYDETTIPTCYQDLWEKEEFHGKYAVPESSSFNGNTTRAILGGILSQYLDPTGELGVSDEGWEAIKQYFDYGYKTPSGEDDFENMSSGKIPITFTFASGLKSKCETFDVEPIIVYSLTGEPTNTNQIGVVENKNIDVLEESKRFANWLGSTEIIGEYASENGSMVANKEAEDYMIPIIKEIKQNYTPLEADWTYLNSMMDEWVAKIQLEIY